MKYFALSLFACAAVMAGQENTEVVAEVAPAVCTEDSCAVAPAVVVNNCVDCVPAVQHQYVAPAVYTAPAVAVSQCCQPVRATVTAIQRKPLRLVRVNRIAPLRSVWANICGCH